jgi:hypothetical protein
MTTTDAGHQLLVHFAEESQAEREAVPESSEAVFESGRVVADLPDIVVQLGDAVGVAGLEPK